VKGSEKSGQRVERSQNKIIVMVATENPLEVKEKSRPGMGRAKPEILSSKKRGEHDCGPSSKKPRKEEKERKNSGALTYSSTR